MSVSDYSYRNAIDILSIRPGDIMQNVQSRVMYVQISDNTFVRVHHAMDPLNMGIKTVGRHQVMWSHMYTIIRYSP
jgi:hypothetical protein